MATNQFFTTHSSSLAAEQLLVEDLIVEAIKVHGIDVYYIPRTSGVPLNNVLGEQFDTSLDTAYPIECYLINFEGYDDSNEFMSKFGLEIRSSTNLVISARSFKQFVGIYEYPREGDLIYVPVLERLFEIKHSDPDVNFHAMGRKASRPYYWEIRVEMFKYSQENIQTGISDIDLIETLNSYTIQLNMGTGSGNYVLGEEVYAGNTYITAEGTAKVADWNPVGKVLSIIDIRGTMNAAANVTGTVSGTTYAIQDLDVLEDHVPDDTSDNAELDDLSDVILDLTEDNPLGS